MPANPTFKVIAAVNRIDLKLPGDCGEYRLVVAADPKWLGATQYVYGREIYFIFEGTLPERGGGALRRHPEILGPLLPDAGMRTLPQPSSASI
ncbi:MAG: hypothetical protein IPK28_16090 [Devosia sp.]|nr:hypothetical protein [Devosia sp.]